MIYIIEPMFKGWQHTMCNKGILELLSKNTTENIVLFAEREHGECIINDNKNVIFNPIELIGLNYNSDAKNITQVTNHVKKIFSNYTICNKDIIISLSSPYLIERVLCDINLEIGARLFFVHHAELDWIINNSSNIDENVLANIKITLENIAKLKEVSFISFSPFVKKRLVGILSEKVLDKFIFLNHPFDNKSRIKKENNNSIGIYGACDNKLFKRMLKYICDNDMEHSFDNIYLFKRCILNTLELKYSYPTEFLGKIEKSINGNDLDEFIGSKSWILLPYDENMYQVSASGILFDAISYEIPIIGMNSPIINYYYKEYKIGILCDSIEMLSDTVIKISKEKRHYNCYIENIKLLKKKITDENNTIIKSIL